MIPPGLKPSLFHFPLPPPCAGIGYSMFSHGGLSRCLDMKSPPPLNMGGENLRGDPGNQAARMVNHASAVRSRPPRTRGHRQTRSLLIFLVLSALIRGESCTGACTAGAPWWPWAERGCWVTVLEVMASRPRERQVRLKANPDEFGPA